MDSKYEKLIIPLNMSLKMAKLAANAEREGDIEKEEMYLKDVYIYFKRAIRYFGEINMNFPYLDMKNSDLDMKKYALDMKNLVLGMKISDIVEKNNIIGEENEKLRPCPCGMVPSLKYFLSSSEYSMECICGYGAIGKTYRDAAKNWNKKIKEYLNEKD